MEEKNYDLGLSLKVYDYYINSEIGHAKLCKKCKNLSETKGHSSINGPIPIFHIGKEYQKSKIKLLFLGSVAYGWDEVLNNRFFKADKQTRLKNKSEIIDIVEKGIEKLFFADKKRMPYFTYMRESSNFIFDNDGYSKIAISNLLKCNSGAVRNHYPQKVFDYCIKSDFTGNLISDLELLTPTHIVLSSSDYRKYGRYIKIIKGMGIKTIMLPHPSSSVKGNSLQNWKQKIKDFIGQNTFTAIDFETATQNRNSACAVGIVTVENGIITDEYYTLIKPPNNEYHKRCIQVHGITEIDTENALTFDKIYPEIKKRLQGRIVVAHNESFDRIVLQKTMAENGLDYSKLNISDRWECTMKLCRANKKYPSSKLNECCVVDNIELNHHEALSDARACAELYLRR